MAIWKSFTGILLTSLFCLATSDIKWNRRSVQVHQGDDVTVTCRVTDLDPFDVVQIVLKKDGEVLPLTDNGALKPFFEKTGRYEVLVDFKDSDIIVAISYTGIRGEDAGVLGCHSLETPDEEEELTLNVEVPMSSVMLTGLSENGEEIPLVNGNAYVMKEGFEMGITCVAKIDGTQTAPQVQVRFGNKDVTGDFSLEEITTKVDLGDQLPTEGNEVRLSYITQFPNRKYNEKQVTCTAMSQNGDTMEATAYLDVYYVPVVKCKLVEYFAQVDKLLDVRCDVEANPEANITYMYEEADGTPHALDNHTHHDRFRIEPVPTADERTKLKITIHKVHESHFGKYFITATNECGIGQTEFFIHKGATEIDITPKPQQRPTLPDKPVQATEKTATIKTVPEKDIIYGQPKEPQASMENSGSFNHVTFSVTIVTLGLSYCLRKVLT